MSEHISSGLVSRRSVLRGGAATAAAAAGLALTSCASRATGAIATEATDIANVRVDHDHYGAHVGPTLAANPRYPRHLFTACQTAHKALGNPDFMTTYLSSTRAQPGGTAACLKLLRARVLLATT